YTPHFDNRGHNGRVLTCIMYLNPFWQTGDGAELKIWPRAKGLERAGPCRDFAPLHGRLVAFLCSGRNLHEVSPVASDRALVEPRVAISCWYYDTSCMNDELTDDAP
ncbi:unnamed protein product, partial [Polarella glacialis]